MLRMSNADNPGRGRKFEEFVLDCFAGRGLHLRQDYSVHIGVASERKPKKFDLGCDDPATIVECKRHTWTSGGNAPSAKLTVWNEAMLIFLAAPVEYRKILAVLRHLRGGESLADHYVKRFSHLVPSGVEIWEFDQDTGASRSVYVGS